MSNLTAEIRKALKSIPDELRAATAAKNQAEADRVATETKAKELDKAMRHHIPDRLVYSRHETNIATRLERFFGTNCQQGIAFAHGDSWVISMLPGVLDSPTTTNDNYYPKIRLGRPGPNSLIPTAAPLAMLSFDPTSEEIQITGSNAPRESDATLKPEDRVAGALVDLFRRSVLQTH